MEKPLREITEELKKRNIRPSFQRRAILEYLLNQKCHPTADEIFSEFIKSIPTLSKSTVYNTLNLFTQKKLVKEVTIENNETRYNIIVKNHGDFRCDQCGEITDFKINIDEFVA